MTYTAIEQSKLIDENFKKYIRSTFQIQDKEFNDIFSDKIDSFKLLKGPYVALNKPYKPGKSIVELVKEGVLSKELLKMDGLNLTRPLYTHQEKAIKKAMEGLNLVISTGTGSGKTESFLLPILNSIALDIENGITDRGIQAMLLYPMNALANDQRERIREILKNYPDITFGHYTGETKKSTKEAMRFYTQEYNEEPLPNELISREQILENPPNLLFTNYSMLEYMLLRTAEEKLITFETSKMWKYIVLDEAHTYKGALGIEIAYLIKRLLGNLATKPKFILTSATLATDSKDFPKVSDFASKLTGSEFGNNSIIIGEHVELNLSSTYRVEPKFYIDVLNDPTLSINKVVQMGIEPSDIHEINLKNILLNDSNYLDFIEILKSPKEVSVLINKMGYGWDEESISAFIQIISKISQSKDISYNEKLNIVDCKYHNFIRSLDGCFVTLKPFKNLRLTKTKKIDELLAFQLGLCRYCQGSYIMGYIKNNKLLQADDEDLYENNDDSDKEPLSVFVIKEDYDNLEDDEKDYESLLEYELCNSCGSIHDTSNLSANVCKCEKKYKILLLKQNFDDKKSMKTNLYKCTLCKSTNSNGIVDSFYVGKDVATSIISQILYKNMDGKYTLDSETIKNPFEVIPSRGNVSEENIKQMIVFSDSRQQASYYATYFEEKHFQFLRKRLILEYLKNNPISGIDEARSGIQFHIDNNKLFKKDAVTKNEAWLTILNELLDVDGNFSMSGMGMVAFLPDLDFIEKLDEKTIKENVFGLDKETVKKLIWFILDSMRSIPAIKYNYSANLDYDTRASVLEHRATDIGGIVLEPVNKEDSYVKSLIPAKNSNNLYTNYLMKSLNVDRQRAIDVLKLIFNMICNLEIIELNPYKNTRFVYDYRNFKMIPSENIEWYQCKKCRKISCINLNDTCLKSKCDGKLQPCIPSEVHSNSYYYHEYHNKELANIRVEEHTAQLTNEQARKYQNDFKNKKINILSCSTTFEMGVDIGSLSTVFMRNVPPSPSNYVQRAGRAGRKKETPAYVLTFCSTGSHDFNYYNDPVKMIEGKIVPPYFELNNSKIYERHILAVALSMYFKKNPELFAKVGVLIDDNGMQGFNDYLIGKPEEFIVFVEKNLFKNFRYGYDKWVQTVVNDEKSKWSIMCNSIMSDLEELANARSEAIKNNQKSDKFMKEIEKIRSEDVLVQLARYNVIPKYGFPVDTVELKVPSDSNLELDRDLTLAISEYAPDSEILVNKKKYTSRYIKKNKINSFDTKFYKKCTSCKSINVSLLDGDILNACKNCGRELETRSFKFIKPTRGFISEPNPKNTGRLKPKRSYSSEVFYLGNGQINTEPERLTDLIEISSYVNDSLIVLNENPFFVCAQCGYSRIERKNALFSFITDTKDHKTPTGRTCSNRRLDNYNLGHDFKTDVVILKVSEEMIEHNMAISMLYALIEGISLSLNIERQDLAGILNRGNNDIQFIFYDNVPGGAGHVKQLLNKENLIKTFNMALKIVSQNCCDENTSCYYCLQNYMNQSQHKYLKRINAIYGLKQVIEELESDMNTTYIDFTKATKNVEEWESLDYLYGLGIDNVFKNNVPLPTYVSEILHIEGVEIEPLFVWKNHRIMYFDEVVSNEVEELLRKLNYILITNLDEVRDEKIWQ